MVSTESGESGVGIGGSGQGESGKTMGRVAPLFETENPASTDYGIALPASVVDAMRSPTPPPDILRRRYVSEVYGDQHGVYETREYVYLLNSVGEVVKVVPVDNANIKALFNADFRTDELMRDTGHWPPSGLFTMSSHGLGDFLREMGATRWHTMVP